MELFEKLKESAACLFGGGKEKRVLILVILLAVLMAALIMLILIYGAGGKPEKIPAATDAAVADQPPLTVPYEPFPDDYYLNRPRDYQWTEEEVNRWFTEPEGEIIETLHNANAASISNLIEAAP